jgi:hypothetical protein
VNLVRIRALPLAIEDGPGRAAGCGIAEDQAVVGLVRSGHRDFHHFVIGDLPDAEGHWPSYDREE